MRGLGLIIAIWCVFLFGAGPGRAQSWGDFRCNVCGALGGRIQAVKVPLAREPRMICRTCLLTVERCSTCRMPEKQESLRALEDGRLICPEDFVAGVFSQEKADELLFRTRTELTRLFWRSATFPEANVTISLVGARELYRVAGHPLPHPSLMTIQGATRSQVQLQPDGRPEYRHQIYVLSGLPPARFISVSAHELSHAWIHENVPEKRVIDEHTIEAFCELVAYQVMDSLREEFEKSVIEANLYTRGRIHVLTAAERQRGFHQVTEWMKHGVDAALTSQELDRIRLTEPPPEPVFMPPVYAVPAPAEASVLTLRGIIKSPAQPLALINSHSFALQERATIAVGDQKFLVHCLEIRDGSVLVEIDGLEKLELFLPGTR